MLPTKLNTQAAFNMTFSLKQFCVTLFLLTFASCTSLTANPFTKTHLHASEEILQLGWIEDFSFIYDTYTAQRQEVVRYSMQMKTDHIRSLRGRELKWTAPTISADADWIIGYSHGWPEEPRIEPQPLYGFTITNPSSLNQKLQVILVGSNHSREDPACWALHGLIEFLVSDHPKAKTLRDNVIFYVYPVVNPDGKLFYLSPEHAAIMTINGSPELRAAGQTNHNRVWQTSDQFKSIDVAKNAMLNDPSGKADYLLDFHGIPMLSFSFADDSSAFSPLARALSGRGHNMREGSPFAGYDEPATLRAWANSPNGPAQYSFTPEISNQPIVDLLLDGKLFALALLDLIEDNIKSPPEMRSFNGETIPPTLPAWSAPGSEDDKLLPWVSPFEVNEISWSNVTPFPDSTNQSIVLTASGSAVDFGSPEDLNISNQNITVSLWAKARETGSGTRYLISVYNASGNQRSWALTQRSNSPDFAVTLSHDGTHNRDQLKRQLSNRWPFDLILGEEKWRHLAFTFDGSKTSKGVLKLYLDGERLIPGRGFHYFDDSQVNSLFDAKAPLRIGALDGSRNAFRGKIAEAALWDKVLSPEEIRWLSQNSLEGILKNE